MHNGYRPDAGEYDRVIRVMSDRSSLYSAQRLTVMIAFLRRSVASERSNIDVFVGEEVRC